LLGRLADYLVVALKVDIEAANSALSAMIKSGRDDDGDPGHRARTLPEVKRELARLADFGGSWRPSFSPPESIVSDGTFE
jgi:hypothetical protein